MFESFKIYIYSNFLSTICGLFFLKILGKVKLYMDTEVNFVITKTKDEKQFKDAKDVCTYGSVRIQPLAYQDDVGSVCMSVKDIRSQARKLENVIDQIKARSLPLMQHR